MMTVARSLKCNGEAIRLRRKKVGFTQEALADLSGLTVRTLQRAEKGEYLSFSAIENIATSLKCDPLEIVVSTGVDIKGNTIELTYSESGNDIVTALTSSFSATIDCKVEPTPENISALTNAADFLEALQPDPWKKPSDNGTKKLSDKLRIALESTKIIGELSQFGLGIYFATYTASARRPRYDDDNNEMYILSNQRYEPVKICKIIIHHMDTESIVEEVEDAWQFTPLKPKKDDLDDDIPF